MVYKKKIRIIIKMKKINKTMKAVFRITLLLAAITAASLSSLQAQRVIKGTVYRNGEPAAGITVEAHRGGTMMTSFDGKYEVEAHEKTKWIKFTYLNDSKRLEIENKTGDVFDFAFEGEIPSGEGDEVTETGVILKSAEDLIREQDRVFMNELSLYNEFYKQDNFEMALPHWKVIYDKYPKSTLNIYIHGANMYQNFIENANSSEKRSNFIDELMKIYDKRMKYYNEKGYVMGRKATAWLKYKLNTDNPPEGEELKSVIKKGYDWLKESVELQGDKTELSILVLLMQTTRSLYRLEEIPQESVVKNYGICNANLDILLKNCDDEELAKKVNDIKLYIEDIFGRSGAASCDALVNIYSPQFQEKNDDIDFIKSMLRRLGNADCEETQLFSDATERLYELEPSAEAAFNMARRYLKKDDTEKAKEYYKQAMEQETDKELLARYYYEYGTFIFVRENALNEARTYARKALEIDPDMCKALMLIGDIYVAASRSFGEDDFEHSTVFWVAVDYFERARRADEECAIDASQKISTYRNYFPSKEEAFFRGLQEGQSYKVGGWINETTKIRF
jgi:tetratricopeptide (TPR) repeat protein